MPNDKNPDSRPPHFALRRRIEFSETDMAGVLHFSNYLRLAEQVEHAFLRSLGISVVMDWDGGKLSWPRVAANFEYFSPLRFEEEVDLNLRVGQMGRKSLAYELEFVKDGRLMARGTMTAICCLFDTDGFRSINVPPRLRSVFDSLTGNELD